MDIQYKLLSSTMKGIITTRQPDIVKESIHLRFVGASDGSTAVFKRKSDGVSIYRRLENEACDVPERFLLGEITVAVSNMGTKSPVFVCEEIKTKKTEFGTLVCPNDNNLPDTLAKVQIELQKVTDDINHLTEKYAELTAKIESLLDGYDII